MKMHSLLGKDGWKFLFGLAIVAFFCSQPSAGFMMLLFAPLALMYQTYKLAVGWKNSAQKHQRIGAIFAIVLASSVVAGAHLYHHTVARENADRLAQEIIGFHALHGRYPVNIAEMGVTESLKKPIHRPRYSYTDGKPMLFYNATFVMFEGWNFDFANRTWAYRPD